MDVNYEKLSKTSDPKDFTTEELAACLDQLQKRYLRDVKIRDKQKTKKRLLAEKLKDLEGYAELMQEIEDQLK